MARLSRPPPSGGEATFAQLIPLSVVFHNPPLWWSGAPPASSRQPPPPPGHNEAYNVPVFPGSMESAETTGQVLSGKPLLADVQVPPPSTLFKTLLESIVQPAAAYKVFESFGSM